MVSPWYPSLPGREQGILSGDVGFTRHRSGREDSRTSNSSEAPAWPGKAGPLSAGLAEAGPKGPLFSFSPAESRLRRVGDIFEQPGRRRASVGQAEPALALLSQCLRRRVEPASGLSVSFSETWNRARKRALFPVSSEELVTLFGGQRERYPRCRCHCFVQF